MEAEVDKSIVVPALTVDAKAVKAAIPAVALDIEVSVPVAAEARTWIVFATCAATFCTATAVAQAVAESELTANGS